MRAVQAADSRLALGILWPFLTDIDAGLAQAVDEGWSAVHPFVTEAGPELVKRAQAAGLAVNVWTVNARHDLSALVELGVEAIITDHLAEALSIAAATTRTRDGERGVTAMAIERVILKAEWRECGLFVKDDRP